MADVFMTLLVMAIVLFVLLGCLALLAIVLGSDDMSEIPDEEGDDI